MTFGGAVAALSSLGPTLLTTVVLAGAAGLALTQAGNDLPTGVTRRLPPGQALPMHEREAAAVPYPYTLYLVSDQIEADELHSRLAPGAGGSGRDYGVRIIDSPAAMLEAERAIVEATKELAAAGTAFRVVDLRNPWR